MRVLLDECVPRALRDDIPGHEVKTVAEAGWAGVKNGELLQSAVAEAARSRRADTRVAGGSWRQVVPAVPTAQACRGPRSGG